MGMTDHILLTEADLLGALEEIEPCPDCVGGKGVHVEVESGEWFAVQVHSVPCPHTSVGSPA